MRTREVPHYALVLWPDDDRCLPACITLDSLAAAVQRGALVLAREDAVLHESIVDLTSWHSNPVRRRYRGEDGFP